MMLQTITDLKFSASLSQYFRCLTVYFLRENLIEYDRLPIIGSFCKQALVFFCISRQGFIKNVLLDNFVYFLMN